MKSLYCHWWKIPVFALTLVASQLLAADAPNQVLLDVSAAGVEKQFTPQWGSAQQVSVARSTDPANPGVLLTIKPGEAGYPGVTFKPADAPSWDLSAYGHVNVRIANTGTKAGNFSVRVENAGDWHDSPWNTEGASVGPGKTTTIKVIFGYSYNFNPGYALKPEAVSAITLYAKKSDVEQSFLIESITAGGAKGEKPPLDPRTLRARPGNGVILGPGAASEVMAPTGRNYLKPWNEARPGEPMPNLVLRTETSGGVKAALAGESAQLEFPAGAGDQSASFKLSTGFWDLTAFNELLVKVKNVGQNPVTPAVQVMSSNQRSTDRITSAQPLAPGEEQEIAVPFFPAAPWQGIPNSGDRTSWNGQPGTGTDFMSDSVASIKITASHEGDATLQVESIAAGVSTAQVPDSLGKRPPVAGDWVKTLDDEFDGPVIDSKVWNIYGDNYWDKSSHWSKDNTILGGGVVRLRYEKKQGYQNDDPKEKQTDYASGYLDTYGKWTQRYGYFEARMKLPTAPGLWPAFWLMPDRGAAAGPQWKRSDTGNGGMEFDVMEHLTRWGPYRYNIAMHWDGYGKQHKQTGSSYIYIQPDKDGFITCGLLWTPGLAVYYCNGREVARWECDRISNIPSDIMFTMPQGGWDNNSIDDAKLPADFVIDYVRVWQRKDLVNYVVPTKPALVLPTGPALP